MKLVKEVPLMLLPFFNDILAFLIFRGHVHFFKFHKGINDNDIKENKSHRSADQICPDYSSTNIPRLILEKINCITLIYL